MSFVHLHCHSHHSICKGIPRVRDLVKKAADFEMSALALTDLNSLAGMGEMRIEAKRFGVRPIMGCELNVLPSRHGVFQNRLHRLVLLITSETGYRNLVHLLTRAHQPHPDAPPYVRFNELEHHLKGLLVLTGTPRGELQYWLRKKDSSATGEYLNRLAAAVDSHSLFFEIQYSADPSTRQIMEHVLELSRFLGFSAVATQNVHYLEPSDLMAWMALRGHEAQVNPHWPPEEQEVPYCHFASPDEMQTRFGYHPELLDQTLQIADRCQGFLFPRKQAHIPFPEFDRGQDAPSVLWDETIRGLTQRYGEISGVVKERINQEYGDIRGLDRQGPDLSAQFLLLRDLTRFLRERGFCHGAGHGNWMHSLIAFALGITQIDPIAHRLEYRSAREDGHGFPLFEIETSTAGMEASLQYLSQHYGDRHIAHSAKMTFWKRSELFRGLCRWAGLPPRSLRLYPAESFRDGKGTPLSSRYVLPPFRRLQRGDKKSADQEGGWPPLNRYDTLAAIAHTLHPCPKALEPVRGQYGLSRSPFAGIVPVIPLSSGEKMAQADGWLLNYLQIPRIQFITSTRMNILESAQQYVRENEMSHFTYQDLNQEDEATFWTLAQGLTNGILPFQSITAKSLLRAGKPKNLRHLVDIHAQTRQKNSEDEPLDRAPSIPEAILGFWSSWMKTHHAVAFLVASLTQTVRTQRQKGAQRPRFQILLREARRMNIRILPPSINLSHYHFTPEQMNIRTGLMAVQGLGRNTFDAIERVRTGRHFSSLADFCHRTDSRSVNQHQVVSLIKSGAFDMQQANRNLLLLEFEKALKNARMRPVSPDQGDAFQQLQLFDTTDFEDETGMLPMEDPDIPLPNRRQLIDFERESLGFTVSYDPLEHYDELMEAMGAISPFELSPRLAGKWIYLAGFIDHAEDDGPLIDGNTALVLDLEGKVVKIPHQALENFETVLQADSPILLEGQVVKHRGGECFLMAQRFYLLEDIQEKAHAVKRLRLNLTGESNETFHKVRQVLRKYRGQTLVEIEGSQNKTWWKNRGIDGKKVFFCPPLYQELTQILGEHRLRPLKKAGPDRTGQRTGQ